MATADRIAGVVDDLAAGRLPDRRDVVALVEALDRMANGLPYAQAVGLSGPIAQKERNRAIVEMASGLAGSIWSQAETIRLRLQMTPKTAAARDAVQLGARNLKRQMLYLILDDAITDETVENPVIDHQQETDHAESRR